MPRVRVICQACGRQLSHLEVAPLWKVRAICPACGATTETRIGLSGEVTQTTTAAPTPSRTVARGEKKKRTTERKAG